ncbi:PP2C family protein-serine/threonine phosphatase [Blautia sp. Sow4_E7]|uniref:PP2C family protein-serine/threonine phosphatase n=1 Tax=Blautia sp. Sow4_E7 TaxID=3438749 RepID=UPI003F8EC853
MTYHINYAYTCHVGKVRPNNEDNFWCCGERLPASNQGIEEIRTGIRLRESLPVLAVFDGMGGESQGEMAAGLASEALDTFYKANKGMLRKTPELFLREACREMNQAVCTYGREQRISAMGTTMAMIAFEKREAHICNLGDSRIYQLSGADFSQISRDHVLKSYRFGKAPLTQFLGVEETEMKLEPSIETFPYQDGDRYLLCSDGVTDMLSDREIKEIMQMEGTVRDLVQTLLEKVLEKGAMDNTTIVLCEVKQDERPLRTWLLQNRK